MAHLSTEHVPSTSHQCHIYIKGFMQSHRLTEAIADQVCSNGPSGLYSYHLGTSQRDGSTTVSAPTAFKW